jgi:benzil reductase ((S)-benzoin forming)
VKQVVWVTGASSGIGAELVRLAPAESRIVGISRRPPPAGDHLATDLSDPSGWEVVRRAIESTLDAEAPPEAIFLHFAGAIGPAGPVDSLDFEENLSSVLLNSASGQVLGTAFLSACARRGIASTVVMCSGPGARVAREGIAQYCAGKAAIEHWTRVAALDQAGAAIPARVFSVVPYGVDTEMARELMEAPSEVLPLGDVFRAAAAKGGLVRPETVAQEIWDLISSDRVEQGEAVEVGAVPERPVA